MISQESLVAALGPSVQVYIPDSAEESRERLARWSNIGSLAPSAIITPSDEDEIVSVVNFAVSEHLQIIVNGGGRGPYVPIGPKALCLDLKKLNEIVVDPTKNTVTVGGGSTTGDTLRACASKNVHTLLPNANSVGVVGAVLGGGSNPFNSIHGLAADHIVSARIVTAEGQVLDLDNSVSNGHDELLKLLGRTGYGIGVVTSMTLKTWPVSDLGMTDNKVWTRTMVFPAAAIETVARLYCEFQPPSAALQIVLIFSRPPKSSSEVGPPTIVLSASFFGPEAEAEKAAGLLLSKEIEKHAIIAKTALTAIQDLNNATEPMNAPGQQKELYAGMLKSTTPSSVSEAFSTFVRFGDECQDARSRSSIVMSQWNPEVTTQNANQRKDLIYIRDRGILVQAVAWYSDSNTKSAADKFGAEVLRSMRRNDEENGIPKRSLAHNLLLGQDLKNSLSSEMISDYLKFKNIWDAQNIFWSPLTDNEHFVV